MASILTSRIRKPSYINSSTFRGLPNLSKFYRAPVALQLWNQEQQPVHASWAELFFDLIFVGVVFEEGTLLSDSFTSGQLAKGVAVFLVTFCCMVDSWQASLLYSSRFFTNDIFHKLADILQMLLVAIGASELGVLDEFLNPETYRMFGFSLVLTLLGVFQLCSAIDLYYMVDMSEIAGVAENMIRRYTIPTLLFAVSCVTSLPAYGIQPLVTVGLWASSLVAFRLDLFLRMFYGKQLPSWFIGKVGKAHSIPMNILFAITRYGEFTMLMLGEGVLQLTITKAGSSSTSYLTFILGYLLMAALQLLHYAREPDHADGHALRRSGKRAWYWMMLLTFYSASLTSVGVGLKLVLKYSSDPKKLAKYSPLLNISCAISLVLLTLSRLCHNGSEEFKGYRGMKLVKKVLIWVGYVACAGILIGLSFIKMSAPVIALMNLLAVIGSIWIQVYERWEFGDSVNLGVRRRHGRARCGSSSSYASSIDTDSQFDDELFPESYGDGFNFHVGEVVETDLKSSREYKEFADCDASGVPFCRTWTVCEAVPLDTKIEFAERYIAKLRRRKQRTMLLSEAGPGQPVASECPMAAEEPTTKVSATEFSSKPQSVDENAIIIC